MKGDRKLLKKKLQFLQKESVHSIPNEGCKAIVGTENDWATLGSDWSIECCLDRYDEWPAYISQGAVLQGHSNIVFEGAQGMLLDEKFGTAPHNTWTDITFTNANELLAESGFEGQVKRVGVIRSYYTRHGAGPFPTEDFALDYPEPHNGTGVFQGKFRQGKFDYKNFNYALRAIGGIDMLAINHLDTVWPTERMRFVKDLAKRAQVVPVICGMGPTYENRISMSPDYQYESTLEGLLNGSKNQTLATGSSKEGAGKSEVGIGSREGE